MQFLPNLPLWRTLCANRPRLDPRPRRLAGGCRPSGLLPVVTVVLAALLWTNGAMAQDPAAEEDIDDFLDMDLEELAETNMTVQLQASQRLLGIQEGLMGGHVHRAGETMVGYRYHFAQMAGNRMGTSRISNADVFAQGFMVAPTRMSVNMHTVHAMHAPSDEWTFMVMVPFKRKSMDHLRLNGTMFNVTTEGIGDVSLTAFYTFLRSEKKVFSDKHPDEEKDCWKESWGEYHEGFVNLGLHFPTGTINETNAVGDRLSYPMQMGSGTYDLVPGFTYTQVKEDSGWGVHAMAKIRLGHNANGYAVGDRYKLTAWLTRGLSEKLSLVARVEQTYWGDIRGADASLNVAMVPTNRADLRGGDRLDFWIGLGHVTPRGPLEGNRFTLEYGLPIAQALNGPQLEMDGQLRALWSWTY